MDRVKVEDRVLVAVDKSSTVISISIATGRSKDYWRIHVSGFSIAAEAKVKASQIKEKLGLKNAWVAKR